MSNDVRECINVGERTMQPMREHKSQKEKKLIDRRK